MKNFDYTDGTFSSYVECGALSFTAIVIVVNAKVYLNVISLSLILFLLVLDAFLSTKLDFCPYFGLLTLHWFLDPCCIWRERGSVYRF